MIKPTAIRLLIAALLSSTLIVSEKWPNCWPATTRRATRSAAALERQRFTANDAFWPLAAISFVDLMAV